jgi:hypothetical protein
MSIRLFTDTQLNQGMYDHEGPSGLQDRDDLRWRFGGDFNGAIGTTVTANVTAYLREYDQAFIDARSSANSRNETEYVIRNGYTWRITPHVTIGQNFGLSSKVLEVVFKPEQNTLNRNHFMNTHLDCQITPRLTINTGFDYLLQDNGGYVRIPGNPEPLFAPTTRTKKDGIGVGIRLRYHRGRQADVHVAAGRDARAFDPLRWPARVDLGARQPGAGFRIEAAGERSQARLPRSSATRASTSLSTEMSITMSMHRCNTRSDAARRRVLEGALGIRALLLTAAWSRRDVPFTPRDTQRRAARRRSELRHPVQFRDPISPEVVRDNIIAAVRKRGTDGPTITPNYKDSLEPRSPTCRIPTPTPGRRCAGGPFFAGWGKDREVRFMLETLKRARRSPTPSNCRFRSSRRRPGRGIPT